MRGNLFVCLFAVAAVAAGGNPAFAAAKISVKTINYDISGRSGAALISAMDRKGPKHGFLTRAIAQTKYTMRSEAVWAYSAGRCRASGVKISLDVTYIYPRLSGSATPELKARFARFMRGVTRHEETHGRIARDMANAADRAVTGLRRADRQDCQKSRALMKRTIDEIIAAHERKQLAFDAREHSPTGNVASLLSALTK